MIKNIKITKIITIILIAICMLLIAPKQVYAENLTFNCFGDSFTITGAGEYDEYKLSHDLCKKTIAQVDAIKNSDGNKKWVPGRTITTPSGLGGVDGYYMMRRRKSIWCRLRL